MKKFLSRKNIISVAFVLLLVLSIILYIKNISAADSQDRIHFIRNEETSGDAIVIESNGHCGLIDTMNPNEFNPVAPDNNFSADNGDKVYNYIKNKVGCNYLDFLVLTHNHSDHIGGVPELDDLINSKTIVFYKYDRTVSDDVEEAKGWHNQDYYSIAINYIGQKTNKTCDVSVSNKQPTGDCYLPTLKNSFITKVDEDPNPFSTYNTRVDYTYYFDFGDYRINMYNLYNNSYHKENLNSIVTLVTHKNSGAKIALTADIETGIGDGEYDELAGKSNLKLTPAGTCSRCKNYGLENQVADVIGKVDILKAAHHGAATSNSLYSLKKYQPSYYISTRELPMKNGLSNHGANTAAILYAYKNYGTISHYTNQASASDGAIIFQINDSSSNKITLLNKSLTNLATLQPDGWARINDLNYQDKAWGYSSNSSLSTGWKELNGHWYYFDSTGIMKEGLIEVDGEVFYLTILTESNENQPHGSMITGWKQVGSDWYYFNPVSNGHRGAAVTGWYKDTDGHWYYLRQSKNEIYYGRKAAMITGLRTVNGKVYYFRQYRNDVSEGPKGSMLTNACTTINNKEYCFDNSGYLIDKTLNSIKDIYLNQNSVLCEQSRVTSGSNTTHQMQGVYFFEKNNVPYAIYSGWTDDDSTTTLTLVNLSTCAVVDRNSSTVMGHANDITYNSSNSTYYVTGGDNRNIYSFKISSANKITNVSSSLTLPENYIISSLTYNKDIGNFYAYHSKKIYKFDGFGSYIYREKIADSPTYYTNFKTSWFAPQGIAYSNNNIYFARTISDTSSDYYNHTYVMVYNATTGKYKYTLHINNSSSTGFNGHVEGISVVGNKLYLGYNVNHTSTKKQAYVVYEGVKDLDDEYEQSLRTKLTKPSLSQTEYAYTGDEIVPVIDNYDSSTMIISGINSATDVGEYSFTIGLKDTKNYVWADDSTDDLDFTWTINQATLEKPIVENYVGTYDGEDHGITISNLGDHQVLYSLDNENFSEDVITRSEAGVTTLYVKFKGDENYLDSESTQATITVDKADLKNVMMAGSTSTYDGEKHYVIVNDNEFATTYYSVDGENWTTEPPYRIDSGETIVYVKLVGDENHNDYGISELPITVTKANSELQTTLLNSHIMKDTEETLLKVTPSVDGVLNITSSDNSIASIVNNSINVNAGEEYNVVVSGVSTGNANITIELTPNNDNYDSTAYEQEVIVIEPPKTVVEIPTANDFCKEGLTYDGTTQTITNNPLTGYTFSNNVQTNAGVYTVVASLQDGYIWSNDTITNKEFNCSIGKAEVEINTNTITNYVGLYDGYGHSIAADPVSGTTTMYSLDQTNWSEFNPSKVDVGTTTVYVKYFGDSNHFDSDIFEGTITINKSDLVIPNNNITNYSGNWDGVAHSISVLPADDATIMYSLDGETFREEKYMYSDVGNYTIYVKYVGDNNHNDSTLYSGTIDINKSDLVIPNDAVQNFSGKYDGESHSVLASDIENATTKYSADGENWSTTNPIYTNVGVYTTYVKYVGDGNHNDSPVYERTVSISKADLEVPSSNITNYSGSYDGNAHSITVSNIPNAVTVYSEDGDSWKETKPSYTNVGEYTIYVKYVGDGNYNDSSVYEGTVNITKADLSIPNNNITNYEGTYDGNEHSLNVSKVDNATIMYSLDQESWSTVKPTRTNVGVDTIYVKYVGDSNYSDSDIYSGTITITKADLVIPKNPVPNVTVNYDGNEHSIVAAHVEGASINYSLNGTNWSGTNPSFTNAGENTIYVKYVGDSNHNSSNVYESTLKINKADLTVPSNNITSYSGEYDGNSHSITAVEVPNATIKYSLDGEEWTTNNPSYAASGTYTIYVKYFGDNNHNNSTIYEGTVSIDKKDVTFSTNVVNSSILEGTEDVFLKVNSNVAGTLNISSSNTSVVTVPDASINISANTDVNISVNAISHGTAQINFEFVPNDKNYNNYQTHKNITINEDEKITVTIPTASSKCVNNLVYTGDSQTLTNGTETGYTLTNNTGVNAGSYTVTASLQDGYVWSDSTFTDKTFNCSIGKANLNSSSISVVGYLGDYDGATHTVTANNVAGATIKYSTDNNTWTTEKPTRTIAGETIVYVKYFGDDNHNDSNIYQTGIVINKASPSISTNVIDPVIYEGEEQPILSVSSSVSGTFNITSSDTSVFTVKNPTVNAAANEQINITINGIKAGNKKVHIEFTPNDSNYKNMVVEETVLVLEPEKISVSIPTSQEYCKQDLKYNGLSQTITNNPAEGYTFSNNVQTNVGTYTVTAKLKDGYKWSDNSLTNKTFDCTIYNVNSYLNVDPSLNLDNTDHTIENIIPNTPIDDIKNKIDTNGEVIINKTDNELASTCDTISINLDNSITTYTLIVLGDINKDGLAKEEDVNLLFNYLRSRVALSDCQKKAGDVVKDSEIHLNDVAKLYQYVMKKIERIDD